jgi:hypothetical protein
MVYDSRAVSDAFVGDSALRAWSGYVKPVSLHYGLGYNSTEWFWAKWPDGIIPYVIRPGGVDQTLIDAAIEHFHTRTNIRFVPWTGQPYSLAIANVGSGADYAPVGMNSGPASSLLVNIVPGSSLPTVIHELGHVVGLFHEHARHDRDQFIIVNYDNIIQEYQFDFDVPDESADIGNYDFLSIMHYPSNAFSANGGYTITKKDGSLIGYNQGLSAGDIAAIEFLYPELGPSPKPAIPTPPPIPIATQSTKPKPKPKPKPPAHHRKRTKPNRHHVYNTAVMRHGATLALQIQLA